MSDSTSTTTTPGVSSFVAQTAAEGNSDTTHPSTPVQPSDAVQELSQEEADASHVSEFVKEFIEGKPKASEMPLDKEVVAEETQEQVQEQPTKLEDTVVELTVNGKKIDLPYHEVIKQAQMNIAAGNQFQKVKEMKANLDKASQAMNAVGNLLKKGDVTQISEVFQRIGRNFDELAVQRVNQLMELETMSPEQRRAYELEHKLKQAEAEKQQLQQLEQQRMDQYYTAQAQQHVQKEIPAAMKTVGIEDTPAIRTRIAQVWSLALQRGQSPTAVDVANYVKKEVETYKVGAIGNMDTEQLIKALGPKAAEVAARLQGAQPKKTFKNKPVTGQPKRSNYTNYSDYGR